MKKTTILLIAMLLVSISTFSQLESFVLDNFENGQVNFTSEVNVNPPASMDIAIVDNPVKDDINSSDKVWEWKRYDTGDNQIWAGFWAILTNEIPNGYHRIEVKFLRTNSTSQLKIKCEGAVTKEIEPITPATKTNEWETLVFDLYANGIKNIRVLGMFPDFYEPIDINAISYIDDIKIIYDSSINPPAPPKVDTLFYDSNDNRFYDQSWSPKATAPSTLALEHWQNPNQTDGDKFPVVTSPIKSGNNALKLKWKSANGGDWSILLASINWTLHDLTQMTHLNFWVNSPTNLSKSVLPKIFFEAGSGNPNKTGTVSLSDYTEDLKANTWTQISIPLIDIWNADTQFTAKDLIKGIFFKQDQADNVEHTVYMDEFIFTRSTQVEGEKNILIDFGAEDEAFVTPGNWNNISDTQAANKALIDDQGEDTGFKLMITDNFSNGYNYNGTTSPEGDAKFLDAHATQDNFFGHALKWEANAANTTGIFTLNGLDPAKYYTFTVFASRMNVSDVRDTKYTVTGVAGDVSAILSTSNNTSNVVVIKDIKPTSSGVITFKTEAGPNNTNSVKFFYLGALKITEKESPTGINQFNIEKKSIYYKDGVLRTGDYTGIINIYNITGSKIASGQSVFGYMPLNLEKGIYIVQTSKGVAKIIAK